MKKILLTGATGFLGSHLTKAFVNEGYEVHILVRESSDFAKIHNVIDYLHVHYVEQGLETVFEKIGEIDSVVHTACCYGRKGESFSDIAKTNLFFALTLLNCAEKFNTDTFFNTDTILQKYLNWYALSKKQFVEWGKKIAENSNIKFVNLKLEHMYGPGDSDSKFTSWIINSCKNNIENIPLTSGEQKRDFVYIDDVVSAYNLLLQKSFTAPFFEFEVGSGQAVRVREFVEIAHQLTNSSSHLEFGAISLREGEMLSSVANIEAIKLLGWHPKNDINHGIRKILGMDK